MAKPRTSPMHEGSGPSPKSSNDSSNTPLNQAPAKTPQTREETLFMLVRCPYQSCGSWRGQVDLYIKPRLTAMVETRIARLVVIGSKGRYGLLADACFCPMCLGWVQQEKLRHTSVSAEIKRSAIMVLNDCVNNSWGDEDAQLDEVREKDICLHTSVGVRILAWVDVIGCIQSHTCIRHPDLSYSLVL
jgi:hypothetical protein